MAKDKDKKKAEKNSAEAGSSAEKRDCEIKEQEAAVVTDTQNRAEDENDVNDGKVVLTAEEFETARAEIAKMKKSMDEAIADAQRIQAEFNNFRKRNASIRAESIDDGIRETLKSLLPILDNFERAMVNSDDSPFAKGIAQIQKQLIDCLKKCGLEEVEAEGVFDPNLHEAVMRDTDGDAESGIITAVLQKGYRVKGKIIRHTMVKVKA